MIERSKDIGLTLEAAFHHRPHLGIGSGVEHLLDDAQPGDLGEAQVLSLVDGAHTANRQQPQDTITILKQVAVGQLALDAFG
jgi:hypothetical protein